MTQAAISYQIKLLEERVGSPLFSRSARGVTLSDVGRRLAPAVSEAFTQMRAAFEDLSETAEGVLRITALSTFATNWLVPRIGTFQLKHPAIAVSLDVTNEMVDLARGEVDVGLRSGHGAWPGLAAHPLMPAAFTPMLSPRLLERVGPLKAPADLLGFPFIDPADDWWVEWFEEAGLAAPDLSKSTGISVWNQLLAGRAALAGQGVAILMPAFFADELASGLLVQPFPIVRRMSDTHYWLVYAEARRRSPKIRAFRDWILAEAAAAK